MFLPSDCINSYFANKKEQDFPVDIEGNTDTKPELRFE